MTIEKIKCFRDNIKTNAPLIHCITNPISINQCANAVLSMGAKPIMAEHPSEVQYITEHSDALLLNLGNITDARIESIKISAKTAKENSIPTVIDAVGASCSQLRRNLTLEIAEKFRPAVIKGNYSEIASLYNSSHKTCGVDAARSVTAEEITESASRLAKQYNCVILASGKTDIICAENKITYIESGVPMLSDVTGTGCMLGALCACFLSACSPRDAACCACITLGTSAQLSRTSKGTGTFMNDLMDNMSCPNYPKQQKLFEIRSVEIEKV